MLEEIIPFPREETTPPVTKMKKVPDISLGFIGTQIYEEF